MAQLPTRKELIKNSKRILYSTVLLGMLFLFLLVLIFTISFFFTMYIQYVRSPFYK